MFMIVVCIVNFALVAANFVVELSHRHGFPTGWFCAMGGYFVAFFGWLVVYRNRR